MASLSTAGPQRLWSGMRVGEGDTRLGQRRAEPDEQQGAALSREGRLLCWAAQSCPSPCDPTDCSPPGSSVRGSLRARILQWVAMPSSRGSSRVATGMSWSPLSDQKGVKPTVEFGERTRLQADSLPVEPQGKPKNSLSYPNHCLPSSLKYFELQDAPVIAS